MRVQAVTMSMEPLTDHLTRSRQNNFWQNRSVAVTGATGLVGSALTAELLRSGAIVSVLVRDADPQSELLRSGNIQRCTVVNGALEDARAVERMIVDNECDTVFHLGAQALVGSALRSPVPTFESNIQGTWHILEACRLHSSLVKRVLFASSDKAYGSSEILPYTEDMPLQGLHPYDVSKSCSDLLAATYAHTYDTPIVVARCGNIYGGGDLNFSRIVPGTMRSFYEGKRPIIRSDGLFKRDYVYVKDAVLAYMLMAEHADRSNVRGQAFNFGPNAPTNVLEMVAAIAKLMHCEHLKPDIQNTAKAEIRDQYLASEKATRVLQWTPAYSLEAGLKETLQWYHTLWGKQ
jgi:CDP-glucose 4,6-dehydratase